MLENVNTEEADRKEEKVTKAVINQEEALEKSEENGKEAGGEIKDVKKQDLALTKSNAEEKEDSLTKVVRKQEAALRKLEAKHGSGYGKPPPGSKSEARAKKYHENCARELVELCAMVSEKGFTDMEGRRAILFGELFNAYRYISDKCSGLLLRARRYKLLDFEGEMLFQGRDDRKTITLIKTFQVIHNCYKETKKLPDPNSEMKIEIGTEITKVDQKRAKKLDIPCDKEKE